MNKIRANFLCLKPDGGEQGARRNKDVFGWLRQWESSGGAVQCAVGGTRPILGKLEIFLVYIRNR
jgi:hypothetical protein